MNAQNRLVRNTCRSAVTTRGGVRPRATRTRIKSRSNVKIPVFDDKRNVRCCKIALATVKLQRLLAKLAEPRYFVATGLTPKLAMPISCFLATPRVLATVRNDVTRKDKEMYPAFPDASQSHYLLFGTPRLCTSTPYAARI